MKTHYSMISNHPFKSRPVLVPGASSARRRDVLILAASGLTLLIAGCDDKPPSPFMAIDLTGAKYGRAFELTDASGKSRTLNDFKGKAVMMFFGFTQCPDICPTSLARAVEIKHLLGDQADRLQVLFMTIDPERDTPAGLDGYMKAFDPSFIGLYGDEQRTKDTAKEFKVYYKKVPTGSSYTMDHTSLTYVYDPAGHLRLAFKHEETPQQCADDLRRLLA